MNLDEVIEYFKSPSEFMKQTGMTSQAMDGWKRKGYIPEKSQFIIEKVSGGKLKAELVEKKTDPKDEKLYLPRFRFYDKERGMCHVTGLSFKDGRKCRISYRCPKTKKIFWSLDASMLMSATSIKDKNGNIIYQGDRLEWKKDEGSRDIVVWGNDVVNGPIDHDEDYEIVGNIHEDSRE